MKFINGVVHIYNNDGSPFSDFIYPDAKMFIDDYLLMVNLISNPPL